MKLSEIVAPRGDVQRSVNLERDCSSTVALSRYVVTQRTQYVLSRFTETLDGSPARAWSLTGPYGMGKSAFCNYLLALLSDPKAKRTKSAWEKLRETNEQLAGQLQEGLRRRGQLGRLLRVPVTAAYEPLNLTLLRGLEGAVGSAAASGGKSKWATIRRACRRLLREGTPSSGELVSLYEKVAKVFGGTIALVVDELGKNLEFTAHHPHEGDIFLLQQLAESRHTLTWVVLHQGFEEYAAGLGTQQRREWAKIQGRFEDIPFIESSEQMLSLIQQTLRQPSPNGQTATLERWSKERSQDVRKAGLSIPLLEDRRLLRNICPLNPLSGLLLPELCRRFAQNDRTLFSFLCGEARWALPRFLREHETIPGKRKTPQIPALGLDWLYDYFFATSSTAFMDRAESQRWFEIQDIIGNARDATDGELAILKAIGVLNLVGRSASLRASRATVLLAASGLPGLSAGRTQQIIDDLVERQVLTYREYADEYRLWEGSDFDIPTAIQKRKATFALRPMQEVLDSAIDLSPLIAARHSAQTGTVRSFERRWASIEDLAGMDLETDFDGLVLQVFGRNRRLQSVPDTTPNGRPIVVAYACQERQIKEFALDAAASQAVLLEASELAHDGVARKEARFRAESSAQRLIDYLDELYDPGSETVRWWACGREVDISSYRGLSDVLSVACDEAYPQCPNVGNEMINNNQLSSAAARARRELAEAMVEHASEEMLGMDGFGPEVAVYRSLFRINEFHTKVEDGRWEFRPPGRRRMQKQFCTVYGEMESLVTRAAGTGISVKEMIDALTLPPFGLREGPIPLLITYFLLAKSDELALFQEGKYLPVIDAADIALMVKRPELFTIRHFAPAGRMHGAYKVYRELLSTDVFTGQQDVRNTTLLKVVAPLVSFMESLPEYTRHTRSLRTEAIKLRSAVLNAREPIDLLLRRVPEALGLDACEAEDAPSKAWNKELHRQLRTSLLELQEAFGKLQDEVSTTLLAAFGCEEMTVGQFRERMAARVTQEVVDRCGESGIRPILQAFLSAEPNETEWACGIAARAIKKNVQVWRDSDLDPFRATMDDLAQRTESLLELIAAGSGIVPGDPNARLISITAADGTLRRGVVQIDPETTRRLRSTLDDLSRLSVRDQRTLLSMLAEVALPAETDHTGRTPKGRTTR